MSYFGFRVPLFKGSGASSDYVGLFGGILESFARIVLDRLFQPCCSFLLGVAARTGQVEMIAFRVSDYTVPSVRVPRNAHRGRIGFQTGGEKMVLLKANDLCDCPGMSPKSMRSRRAPALCS